MRPSVVLNRRYVRMEIRDIAYLRFVLESYDGLAFQRTLDKSTGLVEVLWPASRTADAEELLTALAIELSWSVVPPPEVVPPF